MVGLIMNILRDVFGGIDFSNTKVIILFGVLILLTILLVFAILFVFKLFIPKSKIQDLETINKAIDKLETIMLIDKIVLSVCVVVGVILLILHLTGIADVFEFPFLGITLIDSLIMPMFIGAVFGFPFHGRISGNQRKLNELRLRRDKINEKC